MNKRILSAILSKTRRVLKNPGIVFISLGGKGVFNWMSDERYLKIAFFLSMKKKLNLNAPKTYSEKLQWLKLYDRKEIYTNMVDKYEAKKIVSSIIGKEYIIPTLGVWDKVEDIDFSLLPNQFVLKCTHDSGGLIICKDKRKFDINYAKKKLNRCLKVNYYYYGREWPYKNIKPRIIAEQYMEDESGNDLKDYKWFCFNGVPKALFIASDRSNPNTETKFDFYDMDFNHLPFTNGHPNSNLTINKPDGFDKMKSLAARLSQNIAHARIDFYNINGKIYFGEITFFHFSGMVPFHPEAWDYKFGNWINLPKKGKC